MTLHYQIIPVTAFEQNCSLLWCSATQRAALIDPGGDVERLERVIAEKGLSLEKILLTHGHLDHAGGAAALAEKFSVPIEGPQRADQFWLDGIDQQAENYGLSGMHRCTPTRWLEQGDQVSFGQIVLDVLHCPGHTPGHVVFFSAQANLAWVGDVLFKGSIGRTDFPRGNLKHLLSSIRERLWPLGDDVVFIPGHGPLSTFGDERLTNPFCGDSV